MHRKWTTAPVTAFETGTNKWYALDLRGQPDVQVVAAVKPTPLYLECRNGSVVSACTEKQRRRTYEEYVSDPSEARALPQHDRYDAKHVAAMVG